jgi:hypothetical protein
VNRAWTFLDAKLQMHITQSIMLHFTRFLAQNSQQTKIYTNMLMNWRIMKVENPTSWRADSCFARSKASNDPDQFQNACGDDWWSNWSSNTCRSSLILNFHLQLHELAMHNSCSNSTIQHLICIQFIPENKNMT